MAILLGTQYLMRRFGPPAEPVPAARTPLKAEKAEAVVQAGPIETAPLPVSQTSGVQRELVIENRSYRAVLDTRGALLKSFQLKNYKSNSGQPLELIPQIVPPAASAPLSLQLPEKASVAERVNRGIYEVRVAGKPVEEARFTPPTDLTLRYGEADVQVEKHIRFDSEEYLMEVSAQVWLEGQRQDVMLALGPDIGTEAGQTESDFQGRRIAVSLAGAVQRETFPKGKSNSFTEPVIWGGFESKYFAVLAVAPDSFSLLKINRLDLPYKDASGKETKIPYYLVYFPVGERPVKLYFGPKDFEILERARPGLAGVIDYGWFSFIVKPLLLSLKFVHRFVPNWGVSIILLTLLISLALFPVRFKQMVSMKKMQALQPKLRSIQDRYKKYKRTDPKRQEMNAEVMQLYKEHGVNPLGGCLPLVIQMPFLFAFYRMLDGAIELRGAPFVFWIQDLSKMDPYYVTPILMGGTMVLQQKLTPQTATDPAQARMMMLMPIVFTAMFFSLSSGLVVYFLFSNLFSVGFQKLAEVWMPADGGAKGKKAKRAKE